MPPLLHSQARHKCQACPRQAKNGKRKTARKTILCETDLEMGGINLANYAVIAFLFEAMQLLRLLHGEKKWGCTWTRWFEV